MNITQPPGKTVWSFDVKLTTTRENRIGKQADIGVGYKAFRGSKHISGITGQFRSFIKEYLFSVLKKQSFSVIQLLLFLLKKSNQKSRPLQRRFCSRTGFSKKNPASTPLYWVVGLSWF